MKRRDRRIKGRGEFWTDYWIHLDHTHYRQTDNKKVGRERERRPKAKAHLFMQFYLDLSHDLLSHHHHHLLHHHPLPSLKKSRLEDFCVHLEIFGSSLLILFLIFLNIIISPPLPLEKSAQRWWWDLMKILFFLCGLFVKHSLLISLIWYMYPPWV